MKLLTLNTHSHIEPNYKKKMDIFVQAVLEKQPDIIALQEVNQTRDAAVVSGALYEKEVPENVVSHIFEKNSVVSAEKAERYIPCGDAIVLREDNYVYCAAQMLAGFGCPYFYTWLPIKCGYDIYDEGIALMSRKRILFTKTFTISNSTDYNNWKTRKILGISVEGVNGYFYSVHMGWWDDKEEPFALQWENLQKHITMCAKTQMQMKTQTKEKIEMQAQTEMAIYTENDVKEKSPIWLMGDFNSPDNIKGESYDLILKSGWTDTYMVAKEKDAGITVCGDIDGWHGRENAMPDMRMDFIFNNNGQKVKKSEVMFNGKNYAQVSDHNGILVTI